MKNFCLTLLLALVANLAYAQWTRTALRLAPGRTPLYLEAPAPGVVWAVIHNKLATSPDQVTMSTTGGLSWTTRALTGLRPDEFVTGFSALDAATAWVSVASVVFDPITSTLLVDGRVLHTTNGGLSWRAQTAAGQLSDTPTAGIQFFSATLGVVLGQSTAGFVCLRTTDGGLTWTAAPPLPTPAPNELMLTTPPARFGNHLWVGTDQGRVLHSPDAGLTWRVSTAVANGTEPHQVAFRDARNGLVSGTDTLGNNYLFATADGGLTWSGPRPQPWATGPVGLAPVPNTGKVVLLSERGSAFTADNGLINNVLETQLLHVAGRMVSPTEGYTAVLDTLTGATTGVYRFASQALPTRVAGPLAAPTAYPNPSPDGRFRLPAPVGAAPGTIWRVFDAVGREVLAPQPLPLDPADALVDLSGQHPGLYTLEVRSATGVARQPLLRP